MEFRSLRPDEVECRVQSVKQNGCSLLLYKDARCDMRILDETVGPENWQKEFYECKGTLFCRVGIRVRRTFNTKVEPYDEWVWKSDAGEPSNASAQKGEASDAFKRASTNFGIGRELYTAPFLFVGGKFCNIQNKNGRYVCYDRFKVVHMACVNGSISELDIKNISTGNIVIRYRSAV